jgi:hypothetical protein
MSAARYNPLRLEFEELLIDEAWLLDTDQLEACWSYLPTT